MRLAYAILPALLLGCASHASGPAGSSTSATAGAAASAAPAPDGFVNGPSGRLRVDDGGPRDGQLPPVVFLHGLASNHHVWDEALAHVRQTRRAIALDLHGHGESAPSPAVPPDYSMDAFAADVDAVLDAYHLDRVVLVAHSMSGSVATAYAGAHGARVAGIFYVDPTPDATGFPADGVEQLEAGTAPDRYVEFADGFYGSMLEGGTPETRQRVLAALHSTPQPVFAGAFAALMHYDPKPALSRYRGPRFALVTRGNDEAISIHRLAPGIQHRVLDGVSHWLMLDKPAEFQAALDHFLEDLP
jgi:pimeloyl-ACP methyl ester carboxylesterase